jgi:predicted dehydrogenase/nucleoside-diphosphate-sugar epimerase
MARQHLAALARVAIPAEIVGVYDRARHASEEFAELAGTRSYASIDALLAQGRPDVVHVCTPPAAHYDAARRALDAGAHVYVEKPFALSGADARTLIDLSQSRRRLVCAGHQLLRDTAFQTAMASASKLGSLLQVDSHFAFRPAGAPSGGTGARALADQLIDILPHPLYTLVAVLERFSPEGTAMDIAWVDAGPSELQAVLRAGEIVGRLSLSLRARPIASTLTMTGTRGALTCDFMRSTVVGAANPGTETLEKILNPMLEGVQLVLRTSLSLGRRVRAGAAYPGLSELIGAFYQAVARDNPPPLSPGHLVRITDLFEELAARVRTATPAPKSISIRIPPAETAPLVVVTGASGFLGRHIVQALVRVRGIGRASHVDDLSVHEWISADLSTGVPPGALAGADVVVHAAAETRGGFEAHQRNTLEATRQLLLAMNAAGLSRLVLISSLSVLRPPRTPWERQHEATPRPHNPRPFGPYVWGKSRQEELVEREAAALGISTRIIRPGALIDWREPELPGLMGRPLFGPWHLGFGRPALPIAVCDVRRCAAAIAWCATHFSQAPPVVNLFDPELTRRSTLVKRLRDSGWLGRIVWMPISVISLGVMTARTAASLARGRLPEKLDAWSILRPRRYDVRLSSTLLAETRMVVRESVPQHT